MLLAASGQVICNQRMGIQVLGVRMIPCLLVVKAAQNTHVGQQLSYKNHSKHILRIPKQVVQRSTHGISSSVGMVRHIWDYQIMNYRNMLAASCKIYLWDQPADPAAWTSADHVSESI